MALVMYPTLGLAPQVLSCTLPSSFLSPDTDIASHRGPRLKIRNEYLPPLHAGALHEELPSVESFLRLLQTWEEKNDSLAYAHQLFFKACIYGFDCHGKVSNCFIHLFAGRGAVLVSLQLFNKLSYCDEYSWVSLIEGFLVSGEHHPAFHVIEQLRASCEKEYVPALMGVLKACNELGYIECTQAIHAEIIREECEKDAFFGSALVSMYTKCSLLADAQAVFDEILDVDLILWNTLIGGYVDHGLFEEVMRCLQEMQWRALPPSPVTIVYGLRACVNAGCLEKGRELCTEVFREGFEQDPFIASTLLNMFAKCGSIREAQDIFDELPFPNVVVWNTLITGYVDHGCFDEALACFSRMKLQGLPGNHITFVCILKACAGADLLALGQEIHAHSIQNDYHLNTKVGNALLEMYIKCGAMEEALDVFSEFAQKDVCAWTSLIMGYTECGFGDKALECLEQMPQCGMNPNSTTYLCALKACGDVIDNGLLLHLEIVKKGIEGDDCVGNALVDLYGKYGLLECAQCVFDKVPVQDIISHTTLISRYAEFGFGMKALQLLDNMVIRGVSPSAVTYLSGLGACTGLRSVEKGQEIYMYIVKHGFECVQFMENALLDMYTKCGCLEEAHKVFNELNAQGDISWNTLIMGYAEHGTSDQVLDVVQKMQTHGMYPNVATLLCSLKACGSMGAVDMGQEIHSLVLKRGCYFGCDVSIDELGGDTAGDLSSALIDMYCKCGSMQEAQQVFSSVPIRKTVTFNSLMSGYASQGETTYVLYLLNKMEDEKKQPNEVTFLSIFTVCCHHGCLEKGEVYFGIMVDAFDLCPTVKHHTCIVDLLCRAGRLDEAIVAASMLPVQIDNVVWSSVLNGLYNWKSDFL